MDLPAEFYLQTVDTVFVKHALPKGEMKHRGAPVDLAAIHRVGLLTVEGENDDISGIGQTLAAQDLCRSIPPSMKANYLAKQGRSFRRVQRFTFPQRDRAPDPRIPCLVKASSEGPESGGKRLSMRDPSSPGQAMPQRPPSQLSPFDPEALCAQTQRADRMKPITSCLAWCLAWRRSPVQPV
jgi:PHB de-polymerase C-terminus